MRLFFPVLAALALTLPACGEKAPPTPPAVDTGDALNELGEVYKYRASQRMPPPARAEDLVENEAALGNAWRAIQEGNVVVVWRTGYSSGSSEVLAYEKDVPANGGKVLLRNGTVKQMSADEFRAAKRG